MIEVREVTITLSDAQVAHVLHKVSEEPGLASLFAGLSDPQTLRRALLGSENPQHSRVLLQALLVLAAFPTNGSKRRLADVARQLDLAPSSVHRYAATWVAAGVLEQDLRSRRYGRAKRHATRGGSHDVC